MVETLERLTAGRDFFRQSQLLLGQLFNPLFERMGDQLSLGLNDPVEQHFDLAFGILELRAQGLHAAGAVLAAHFPSAFEGSDRKVEKVCGGRECFEQRFKLPFDLRALDRLAVHLAATLGAEIVGIQAALAAARPRGRKGRPAGAMDEAAQREVFAQILARRSAFIAIEAGNDPVVCLNADKRLMQALAHGHIPIRR